MIGVFLVGPIPHERGFDALRALVGLQADLVDVVAAGGEGTHHLGQLARSPDIDVVCSGIEPTP